jgi:hypothetical protein
MANPTSTVTLHGVQPGVLTIINALHDLGHFTQPPQVVQDPAPPQPATITVKPTLPVFPPGHQLHKP